MKIESIKIVPNPATDLIAIQMNGLVKNDLKIDLYDVSGKLIKSAKVIAGQSIAYFDVQDVYNGTYFVKITDGSNSVSKSIIIKK